jgi:hypothetical protein
MTPSVTAGMQVVSKHHPEWREGVVMGVQGPNLRVFFVAHPSRKQVLVPSGAVTVLREGAWDAAQKSFDDRAAAALAKSRSPASRPKRKWSTMTQDEAEAKFLAEFPKGFEDPKYLENERDHKWKAHEAFAGQLGGDRLRTLVTSGNLEQLAKAALDPAQKANLLSPFEKSRVSAVLREGEPALAYFRALADLLDAAEVEEATFGNYLKAVEGLPGSPQRRVDTWPIATILPFLAQPQRHLFVKPNATRGAAERVDIDLRYESTLNWQTYDRARQVGAELRKRLEPHGCKDMIDVQSFISLMV